MFPNDISDLMFAFILLVLLVVAGTVVQKTNILESQAEKDIKEIIGVDDAREIFLLNYVKTNTESGRINDLIREAEDDEDAFSNLEKETDELMGFGLARRYDVKISYPDEQKRLGGDEFKEYKEIKLPSKTGEMIIVELGIDFDKEWV